MLMGYYNPILAYGADRFLDEAADSGIDGVIVSDLPLEEGGRFREAAARRSISTVLFVTPTTPPPRMKLIDEASSGFVYGVSVTGVTGSRPGIARGTEQFLASAAAVVRRNPLLAGFGIATPTDAARISRHCAGVIVGSALVETIAADAPGGPDAASSFISAMRRGLDLAATDGAGAVDAGPDRSSLRASSPLIKS